LRRNTKTPLYNKRARICYYLGLTNQKGLHGVHIPQPGVQAAPGAHSSPSQIHLDQTSLIYRGPRIPIGLLKETLGYQHHFQGKFIQERSTVIDNNIVHCRTIVYLSTFQYHFDLTIHPNCTSKFCILF
jgi:hypothetical protein